MSIVSLPRTGWTQRYMLCDDGYHQAGVAWPNPRFTDNGDGTLTDKLTGLMWVKDASTPMLGTYEKIEKKHWWSIVQKTLAPGSCEGGDMSWEKAFRYIECLNAANYLGHSDWQLPNINELESLAGYGPNASAVIRQAFTSLDGSYWSSTTMLGAYPFVWIMEFIGGNLFRLSFGGKVGGTARVWPVRRERSGAFRKASVWATGQTLVYCSGDDGDLRSGVAWPSPRFADNGDETVTDNLTGLMWTKDANLTSQISTMFGGNKQYLTSQGALEFVSSMNSGSGTLGYNDWRLPNIKEIRSLVDYSRHSCALMQGHPFMDVQPDFYWSSSPYNKAFDLAWVISMENGLLMTGKRLSGPSFTGARNKKQDDNKFCVWPVRAGVL